MMSEILCAPLDEPRLRVDVERELQTIFDEVDPTPYGDGFARLWNLAVRHIQGGKLLRPLLLLETYDALHPMASVGERQQAVRVAAAIETLHCAFLLHDDVIDQDLLRRGRLNLIGELVDGASTHVSRAQARGWAQAGGILAGDLLLASAHQIFARVDVAHELRLRVLDLLQHTVHETTAGEFADVGLAGGVITPELRAVLDMTRQKTAGYSFELPLRAAVILSGGSLEREDILRIAGSHLGIAYQLQDDLLSTFGDATVHGKDAYSDLREGKQTALICFARMSGAWHDMQTDFGDPQLSTAAAQRLRAQLRACGAEDFVSDLIEAELAAFHQSLDAGAASMPDAARSVLRSFARGIQGRTS